MRLISFLGIDEEEKLATGTGLYIIDVDCKKELIADTNASLVHILREANKLNMQTSLLRWVQGKLNRQLGYILVPPNEVVEEMLCDLRGVAYGRGA